MTKITKRTVDAASPQPGRRYIIWDNEHKGFGGLDDDLGILAFEDPLLRRMPHLE